MNKQSSTSGKQRGGGVSPPQNKAPGGRFYSRSGFQPLVTEAGRPRPIGQRGSILVFVLVMLALGALMLTAFKEEAISRIKYYGSQYERDDLRLEAYSQLELALAVISEIKEIDTQLNSPAQGWRDPYTYAGLERPEGFEISFKVEDESGKIPITELTPTAGEGGDLSNLEMFLEEMGMDQNAAQDLTYCLMDWVDEDDDEQPGGGAEKDFYEDLDPPYLPANGPIKSFEELALIEGFKQNFFDENGTPNQFYKMFTDNVSLYNKGKVNINTATPLVAAYLGRVGNYETRYLQDYLNGDDGEFGTEDDNLINDLSDPNLPLVSDATGNNYGITTDVLKVTVRVKDGGGGVFSLTAIVATSGATQAGQAGTAGQNNTGEQQQQRNNRGNKQQAQARTAQTAQDKAAQELQYPFEIIRITENYDL